jgi:hypothetical protein
MKKSFAKSLLCGVSVASMSLVGCGAPQEHEEVSVEELAQGSSALAGEVLRVTGDMPCPSGYVPASPQEARANVSAICNTLGAWDILRLAGGGSMEGPGYGCTIRDSDTRGLGHSLCKKVNQFTVATGDGFCPSSYTVASPLVARANPSASCNQLGTWYIARLAGGGSMEGPGYGCTIREADTRGIGHTLCAQYTFIRVNGDSPCGPGKTLLTPQEARARTSEVCSKLASWDIARLEGGGSIEGPGYGCTIRDSDTRGLGHAVCKSLY